MRPATRGVVRADHDAVRLGEVARPPCPRGGTRGSTRRRRPRGRARRARGAAPCPSPPARSTSSRARRPRRLPAGRRARRATRPRSASPEAVGGVSTQTNATRARPNSSSGSIVKCRRAAFRRTSSVRPGSCSDTSPRPSAATRSRSTSRPMTSWPRFAKRRSGDESDPADADHAERLACACAHFRGTECRLRAIATIVLLVSTSPSVLSIQTTYWRFGP